jgi:demethylmenaquinone methyltransferase / 2-methoxy-6-polyprenyl-1,4-benzoquinol methylase
VTNESSPRSGDQVRAMFGSIAWRYDLANHLLSCGFDFHWRKRAAEIVAEWRPQKIVDLATGTGDLALAIQRKLPDAEITCVDFSEEMLARARSKGVKQTLAADVLALPFPDRSADCVTIAFGLRNVTDWAAGIREMARVLVPNGHLLVLEFSLPRSSVMRAVYRFYLHRIMPAIGSFLTRKKSAYDYLGESIEAFPSGKAAIDLINANQFREATAEPLTGGIVTIYTATKTG